MSRVWMSRIMGGAASVALAAVVLAAPLAAGPPECSSGSCPTGISNNILSKIPYITRLFTNEGSGCDSSCKTAAFEFELVQTADGFKLQPIEPGTCKTTCSEETAPTFSPFEEFVAIKIECAACDKGKCSTGKCATSTCAKSACSAATCDSSKCKTAACSKTVCDQAACAKQACQNTCAKGTCAKACTAACKTAACAKSECAKGTCAKAVCAKSECAKSCTSACAKSTCAKAACCSKSACSKPACAQAVCAKAACSKSACSKSACAKAVACCASSKTCATKQSCGACKSACSKSVCAKSVCSKSACSKTAASKCCAACKCGQSSCDKTAARESAACGKLCGVIDIDRCEVAGDATLSQLWQMASAHCPLFNGHGVEKPEMVPAAVAKLEAKVAALETMTQAHEFVAEQREALYESLIHLQREASENKAAMTEMVFSAMFQAFEAKTKAAEESLAEYRRIIEEAAEVHVTNATLQAKLEAAEAKLELVHTLARLQLENDQLKQQIAARQGGQGEAFTSTCPVTKTATPKIIGTCTTGTACATPAQGTCTTSACNGSQPQMLSVPPTRLTTNTTTAPQQFAVHIRLYQETGDQATKQLAAPVILVASGRKFSFLSGGVIQAGATDLSLPLGTQVEGCLGKCTSEGVQLDLSIQHRVHASGNTQAATVVSQCGGQIAGCIPLGKPVKCTLGQPNGQPICVEIKIEPACAPEVAEQR